MIDSPFSARSSRIVDRTGRATGWPLPTLALCLLTLGWAVPGAAQQPTSDDPSPGDGRPSTVSAPLPIVSYQQLAADGRRPGPSLAVYADGRIEAHFPPGDVRAPSHDAGSEAPTAWLEPAELDALIVDLLALGLPEIDGPAVDRRLLEVMAERGRFFEAAGAGLTLFELRLEPGQIPAPFDPRSTGLPIHCSIVQQGLRFRARAFPEIDELARLLRAEERLLGLLRATTEELP